MLPNSNRAQLSATDSNGFVRQKNFTSGGREQRERSDTMPTHLEKRENYAHKSRAFAQTHSRLELWLKKTERLAQCTPTPLIHPHATNPSNIPKQSKSGNRKPSSDTTSRAFPPSSSSAATSSNHLSQRPSCRASPHPKSRTISCWAGLPPPSPGSPSTGTRPTQRSRTTWPSHPPRPSTRSKEGWLRSASRASSAQSQNRTQASTTPRKATSGESTVSSISRTPLRSVKVVVVFLFFFSPFLSLWEKKMEQISSKTLFFLPRKSL